MKLLSGSYLDAAYVAIAIVSYMGSNLETKSVCTNIHLSSIKPCRSALQMLWIPQYGHCNNVIQRKDFYILALPQIYYHEAGHDIPGCFPSEKNYYLLYVYAIHPLKQRLRRSLSLILNIKGEGLQEGQVTSGFTVYLEKFPRSARFVFLLFRQPHKLDVMELAKSANVYDLHDVLTTFRMCNCMVALTQFISLDAALYMKVSSMNETHLTPEYLDYPMMRYSDSHRMFSTFKFAVSFQFVTIKAWRWSLHLS